MTASNGSALQEDRSTSTRKVQKHLAELVLLCRVVYLIPVVYGSSDINLSDEVTEGFRWLVSYPGWLLHFFPEQSKGKR